jgi:hypothetical protein
MTTQRHNAFPITFRFCLTFGCALLLVSFLVATPMAEAATDTPLDAEQLAALDEQQRIDQETGAFASPLLIRLRARVSPSWPGPRGEPPVTERSHCPVIPEGVGGIGSDTDPGFC